MLENDTILKTATFNPKVKTYIFLVVTFYLVVTIAGLVLLPFGYLALGNG